MSAAVSISMASLPRKATETWSKTILPRFLKCPQAGDSSYEKGLRSPHMCPLRHKASHVGSNDQEGLGSGWIPPFCLSHIEGLAIGVSGGPPGARRSPQPPVSAVPSQGIAHIP